MVLDDQTANGPARVPALKLDAVLTQQMSNPSQVADLWQAHSPAATASKMLCLRTEHFPVSECYSLPPGSTASTVFSDVMAAAEASLLAEFGDACAIVKSPALAERFLSLPQPAMLALLQSPELKTDAEATVLLLLNSWTEEPAGMACCAEQVDELYAWVRYSRISRPFLAGLCDLGQAPQLKPKQLLELWEFCSLPSETMWVTDAQHNPAGWYLPKRPIPPAHESRVQLQLVVTEAALRHLLGRVGDASLVDFVHASEAVYAEGYMWRLEFATDGGNLWCTVNARGVPSLKGMAAGFHLSNGVICTFSLQIDAVVPFEIHESMLWVIHTDGAGSSFTAPDGEANSEDPTRIEWWARYIVDGRVSFTAVVEIGAV